MIIEKIRTFDPGEVKEFSWLGLRRFKNLGVTKKVIKEIHNPPAKHAGNVAKQAKQIRQCIIQAEEYFQAAENVSDAIRPLLLYYGALSLSLCQVLLKADGRSSLDSARGKHAHHGLELKVDGDPSSFEALTDSASALRAIPHIRANGERFGTFALWHRISREQPFAGKCSIRLPNGQQQVTHSCVAVPDQQAFPDMPSTGVSLLWCFQNTPGMRGILGGHGVPSFLVEGFMSLVDVVEKKERRSSTVLHPYVPSIMQDCLEGFAFDAKDLESIEIIEMPDSVIIKHTYGDEKPAHGAKMPMGFQSDSDKINFCARNNFLNEFGVYLTGLYILGNYCRYYPDMWMNDLETSSDLYMLSSRFLDLASSRLPVLTYCELQREMPVLRVL